MPQAVKLANLQLLSLNRSVMRVNENMTLMGRRMVTGLLGLAGLTGTVALAKQSLDVAKEEGATRAALNNLIMNANRLRGIGLEQSKQQVEMLERQAKVLQESSGIYSGIILKGDAYLAQFRLSAQTIKALQPAFVDILAYQRSMGRSAEEMPAVYEDIGKAIQGQTKGLRTIGVVLTEYEQRVIKWNAAMGRYQANAVIIAREIERQHGGSAAAFMKTPAGLAAKEAADMLTMKGELGKPLKTLLQLAQITVDKLVLSFFGPIAKNADKLNQMLLSHWQQWVAYVDRYLVPAFQKFLKEGWQKITQAVAWFQQNSAWLLPWIKNVAVAVGVWTVAIGPLLRAIALLRTALLSLSLSNPFTALALAAGIAAAYIITHWQQVKTFLAGIWESIMGTKSFNASLEPAGVLRAYRKGVVPRAQPVQLGWIGQLKQMWQGFYNWLGPETQKNLQDIGDRFRQIFGGLIDWWNANVVPTLPGVWKDITDMMKMIVDHWLVGIKIGIEVVIGVADRWLIVIQKIGDAFNAINGWLDRINQHGYIPGMGDKKPDYGQGSRDRWKSMDGGWHVWNPPGTIGRTGPVRALTYGPHSEGATSADLRQIYGATIGGQKIRLSSQSAAISPNLLGQYPLGSWVDEYANGKLVRHRRIEDTSWIRSGVPTYNTIENYNDIDLHRVQLKRSPIQGPATEEQLRGAVTLNYNPEIHFHGDYDEAGIHSRMAQHHRRAVDQFQKMLAEAVYMRNRSAFDGANAV
jgi:hypothetical protein